ncbi:sensor histidine kinase [Stappia indica]|uniref:sensor histidine kinase n=1 Tax=Stappia indica TaxID=538381 RepID=UPI001D181A18|nr:PAS domain-containing sensor histidine kinase [Stappia indica]MCC4244205.1 PAS domain S-box protein [Stappia indica]
MNSQLSTFMALSGLAAASSHLTDARPAWIWAEDGKTLLWANPAGAAFFGVGTLAALSELSGLGRAPARPHIARVAASGPTERDTIDRLRFYRGLRVMLLTCACRRLDLPNGSSGALIVALDAPANAADGEETALLDFLGGEDHVAVLYRRDGTMLTGGAGELELPDADSVRAALRQAKHAPLLRDFTFGGALHQAAVLTLDSGSVLMVADAKGRPLAEDAAPAIAPDISPALDDAADAAEGMTEDRAEDTAEDTVPAAPVTEPPAPTTPPRSRLSMGGLFAFASGTRFLPAGRTTDTAAETPGPSAEATPAPDDVAAERPTKQAIETALNETAATESTEAEAVVETAADAELHEEAQEETGALETTETLVAAAEAIVIADEVPAELLSGTAPQTDDIDETRDPDADPALPLAADEAVMQDESEAEAEAGEAPVDEPTADPVGDATALDETLPTAAPGFAFEARERPVRFAWKMDVDRRFTFISPEFAEALGPQAADVVGLSWEEVAERLDLDGDGRVAAALRRRDTWSGRTVDWPVSGAALRVPVDMAALPAFDRQRVFEGFRGFGVCRTGEASEDPAATGLALTLREEAAAEPQEIAAEETEEPAADADSTESPAELDEIRESETHEPQPEAATETETETTADAAPQAQEDAADLAAVPASLLVPAPEEQAAEPAPRDLTADVADLLDLPGAREIDEIFAADTADQADAQAEENATSEAETETADADEASVEAGTDEAPAVQADLQEDLPAETELPAAAEDAEGTHLPEETSDDAAETAAEAYDEATAPAEAGLLPLIEPQAPVVTPDTREPQARTLAQETTAAPRRDEDLDTSRLSKPEREAFRKIAEALGARSELDKAAPAPAEAIRTPADPSPPATDAPVSDTAEEPAGSGSGAAAPLPPTTTTTIDGRDAPNVASLGIIPRMQTPSAPRAARTSLLDKLPVGVAIIAGEDVDYANATLLDLLGYADLDTLKSVGGLDTVFAEPEDWPSALPGAMTERTMRIRVADGSTKPVKARLHTVPWKEGTALMMSLLDRHDPAQEAALDRLHETQSALALAEEHLAEMDAVLETATDGVLILDEGGRIMKVNRSAEALFDGARENMIGAPLTDFLAPESHRDANDYLDGLARNGVASVLNDGREVIGQLRSGGLIPLFMTIGRVGHGSEGPRFCTVLRDITQWKTAEEELTDAKRQAENASSQKSDFLAKISHEIRTPLNAIIGFSEVMMEERFGPVGNDRYKGYLRDIHNSGSHIMSLINDLLDLSKIEAGKLDLTFEAVSANDIIRECVALMQPQANRERVIIRASLPTSVPKIVADGRSVRQIVLNLLSNAIKFNQPGGQVIVSTALEDTGEVILRVRDTGMGMSHQDLAAAMEPFRQLHTARHGGGTGLGLPLTKALVEANRASFRIDSEVNHGTLVEVTFPPQRVLAE